MNLEAKCFKNKTCKACIKKNIKKYGSFTCKCDGITVEEDVAFAIKNGMSEHDARWAYDACYFFEKVYGTAPRWYQKPILQCSSRNLVSRQCRQSGKTLAITMKIMHFVITNERKDVIILTPQEKQIKKIFDEYIHRDCIGKSSEIKASLSSSVQKPYYQVTFDNGSTVKLMVANEGARGQTCSWLYIDEAALIGTELLNSILMTVAAKADEAVILMTSTPRGRGNMFYKSCKEDPEFNEYHVPISVIEEMVSQTNRFKKLLGETGYMQECEAEFPDISGGPFNLKGVALSQLNYEYADCVREPGLIYIGGVDWNGPSIGTYFYVISFNASTLEVKIVDKQVVASATWNSTVAKNTLIELNRKWVPKHWMCDYGYGHDIIESLKLYSVRVSKQLGGTHPDSMLKYILEPVEFGGIMEIKDPFTKEDIKKTTKAFIVSQASRLFEPAEGTDYVPVSISKEDKELVDCLENYKLLNVTAKGFEQFGFEKNAGIEDHPIDAFMLAVFGIVKHYNDLFKRVVYQSVPLSNREILHTGTKEDDQGEVNVTRIGGTILLTHNRDETTYLEDKSIMHFDPDEKPALMSKLISKSGISSRDMGLAAIMSRRTSIIKRTINF